MGAATALRDGTAFLVGDGGGIFNGVYIDNLVACIQRCLEQQGDVSGFFNVGDGEQVTWRAFYGALAPQLGRDVETLPSVGADRFRPTVPIRLAELRSGPVYQALKGLLPPATRQAIKARLTRRRPAASAPGGPARIVVTREMWHLQTVRHKLPIDAFCRHFAYAPPVSFEHGMQRTIAWLRATGFVGEGTAPDPTPDA
jgi:nucleoside-diphosphate-sugar epimerase